MLLLALCYLSYFAGLLFIAWWSRSRPLLSCARAARARPRAAHRGRRCAAALAFAAYYVNWTWPFLVRIRAAAARRFRRAVERERGRSALPALRGPHKLAYTFGSVLVPVLGVAGLVMARRGVERVLLLAWAAILLVFSGLDLFFNFLLKHHYFTMVPVAVGGGVLLARVAERGRWGRAVAVAALVGLAVLGARVGLDAATGRIP